MKLIAPITFLLMAIIACVTVWFVSILKPSSIGAFVFFAVWLIAPNAIMSVALMFLRSKYKSPFYWCVIAVIVSIGGILLLADVIFWHPDAQGAMAVLMVPIFQGGVLIILLPIAWWMSRNTRLSSSS